MKDEPQHQPDEDDDDSSDGNVVWKIPAFNIALSV